MITVESLNRMIGQPKNKTDLICGLELRWRRKLEDLRAYATLVVYTRRILSTTGGDGWHGLDSTDIEDIHGVVLQAVRDDGSYGLIDEILIKQATEERYGLRALPR